MAYEGNLFNSAIQGLDLVDKYYSRRKAEDLAGRQDLRAEELFDMRKEQYDIEKEIRRREEAGQKLHSLSLDSNGKARKFTQADNAYINRAIVPVLNEGGLFDEFLTSNSKVATHNPIAHAFITPDADGVDRVTVGLRMKDGSVKPWTINRGSDPKDPIFAPTVPEFMQYVQIQADPRGTAARLADRQYRRADMEDFKQKELYKSGLGLDEYRGKKNVDFDYAKEMQGIGLSPTGKQLKAIGGAGGLPGIDDENKVQRKNGQWITESTLRNEYIDQFGSVDSDLGRLLNDDAPNYYEWRNNQVRPEYSIIDPTGGGAIPSDPLEWKKLALEAKSDPVKYEQFIRQHPDNKGATEEEIREAMSKRFGDQAQEQAHAQQQPGNDDKTPGLDSNDKERKFARASKLIDQVEKVVESSSLTKSLARAQLNRLSGIEDAGTSNYRLMKLRKKLEDVANEGVNRKDMTSGN
ncbi:MAG: hypothetical protein KZQ73_08175 [Candidatus Thiodiazotropha sp. (ex Semelilucina semeliformis)]|nr:hypothetical protein [Candidatus Thiodiazotropha sp. (ex Semelilucina semeliformis)]